MKICFRENPGSRPLQRIFPHQNAPLGRRLRQQSGAPALPGDRQLPHVAKAALRAATSKAPAACAPRGRRFLGAILQGAWLLWKDPCRSASFRWCAAEHGRSSFKASGACSWRGGRGITLGRGYLARCLFRGLGFVLWLAPRVECQPGVQYRSCPLRRLGGRVQPASCVHELPFDPGRRSNCITGRACWSSSQRGVAVVQRLGSLAICCRCRPRRRSPSRLGPITPD